VQNSEGYVKKKARRSQGYEIMPCDPRDAPQVIQDLADADDGGEDEANLQNRPG
jgi:hypothetical protein